MTEDAREARREANVERVRAFNALQVRRSETEGTRERERDERDERDYERMNVTDGFGFHSRDEDGRVATTIERDDGRDVDEDVCKGIESVS